MFIIGIAATKGGVGKTTIAANLGGLLADLGLRVLLIDADVQPSLTRYFALGRRAPDGLARMVVSGSLAQDCISEIALPPKNKRVPEVTGTLHIVASDAEDSKLQDWLAGRPDTAFRIRIAIRNSALHAAYDIAIIDTQGAVGHLQDAAINASNLVLLPASPDTISAQEFVRGTGVILERHKSIAAIGAGFNLPRIKAVINRTEHTNDSREMSEYIKNNYLEMQGTVEVLETRLPYAVSYKNAARKKVPAHYINKKCAGDMHKLIWELIPSLHGQCAPGFTKK